MPTVLALDWDQDRLWLMEAELGRNGPRVRWYGQLQWPEELEPWEQTEQAAEALRQFLQHHHFSAKEVTVALGRSEVVARRMSVPLVPQEELPQIVRIQAETKVSTALDQLRLDFVPLGPRGEQQEVLLVELQQEKFQRLTELLDKCGLSVRRVTISSVALAQLLAQLRGPLSAADAELIVLATHTRVEVVAVRGQSLVFSHGSPLASPGANGQQVLLEVQRCLGALRNWDPELSLSRIWVLGPQGEQEHLAAELQQRVSPPVEVLDLTPLAPKQAPQELAAWSVVLGLLSLEGQARVEVVDFLHPRQPPAPAHPVRRRLIGALVGAGVVLGLLASWVGWQAARLDEQIAQVQTELERAQQVVQRSQKLHRTASALQSWQQSQVAWLPHLQQLLQAQQVHQPPAVYLTQLHLESLAHGRKGQVRVQGSGRAQSRQAAEEFLQFLADRGYRVRPQALEPDPEGEAYPWRFGLDVEVPSPAKRSSASR